MDRAEFEFDELLSVSDKSSSWISIAASAVHLEIRCEPDFDELLIILFETAPLALIDLLLFLERFFT